MSKHIDDIVKVVQHNLITLAISSEIKSLPTWVAKSDVFGCILKRSLKGITLKNGYLRKRKSLLTIDSHFTHCLGAPAYA